MGAVVPFSEWGVGAEENQCGRQCAESLVPGRRQAGVAGPRPVVQVQSYRPGARLLWGEVAGGGDSVQ